VNHQESGGVALENLRHGRTNEHSAAAATRRRHMVTSSHGRLARFETPPRNAIAAQCRVMVGVDVVVLRVF
jgi:hypothetical protein